MNAIAPKLQARLDAASRAAAKLAGVNMLERLKRLGLAKPDGPSGIEPDGSLVICFLGHELRLTPPDYRAVEAATGAAANLADRILTLHYLLNEAQVSPAGEWISFRDFPGGSTYWPSLAQRSVQPLAAWAGNNLDRLGKGLSRFSWRPMELGDFSARVQVIGPLEAALVYHLGDEELPAQADVLLDAAMRKAYCTEDVAVICQRLCLGMMESCRPCIGCGVCDVDVT